MIVVNPRQTKPLVGLNLVVCARGDAPDLSDEDLQEFTRKAISQQKYDCRYLVRGVPVKLIKLRLSPDTSKTATLWFGPHGFEAIVYRSGPFKWNTQVNRGNTFAYERTRFRLFALLMIIFLVRQLSRLPSSVQCKNYLAS